MVAVVQAWAPELALVSALVQELEREPGLVLVLEGVLDRLHQTAR
jgi:hypothetical protein